LPGQREQHCPITLDLNGHVAIRGQENLQAPPTELILSQSRREGEQVCVNLNREFLAQAVKLGFREVRFANPNSPTLCVDERRQYLFALLDAKSVIRPSPDMIRIQSIAPKPSTSPTPIPSPITIPMNPTNRMNPQPAPAATTASNSVNNRPSETPATPIEAVLTLRATLREALEQTNLVLSLLKHQKKQSRLVQSTLASLKQLQAAA